MARFIDTHEAEIPILAHFTVLFSINKERCITSCAEFGSVRIINAKGDGLAAEPVTDVVSVTVIQSYADGVVENRF